MMTTKTTISKRRRINSGKSMERAHERQAVADQQQDWVLEASTT